MTLQFKTRREMWLSVFLLPFAMYFVVGLINKVWPHLFGLLPLIFGLPLLALLFFGPSYGILVKSEQSHRKTKNMLIFSACLLLIVPALLFFGMIAGCAFFGQCL